MIKMKGYLAVAMAMAALASESGSPATRSTFCETDVLRPKIKIIPKGLKEYTIDGITVMALNYKNAVRKVNLLTGGDK
jgi:hypothetical protein